MWLVELNSSSEILLACTAFLGETHQPCCDSEQLSETGKAIPSGPHAWEGRTHCEWFLSSLKVIVHDCSKFLEVSLRMEPLFKREGPLDGS